MLYRRKYGTSQHVIGQFRVLIIWLSKIWDHAVHAALDKEDAVEPDEIMDEISKEGYFQPMSKRV